MTSDPKHTGMAPEIAEEVVLDDSGEMALPHAPPPASPRPGTNPRMQAASTTARLLAQALAAKTRSEEERHRAETRALDAERKLRQSEAALHETRMQLETLRSSSPPPIVESERETVADLQRQVRMLKAELDAANAAAEDNVRELAALRVQVRAAAENQGATLESLELTRLHTEADTAAARAEIARIDVRRTRLELDKANEEVHRLVALLESEQEARGALEQVQSEMSAAIERARQAAQDEAAALQQAVEEQAAQLSALRTQLSDASARLAQAGAMASHASEVARLSKDLAEAEIERKEALERARRAERELGLKARELEALTDELRHVRTLPTPAATAVPAAASTPIAEELAKAQKRLNQYGEEIKRLRAELTAVGRG